MAFTDIFIRRPVLSIVVSLLILLIGLEGRHQPSGSAISEAVEHGHHRHDDLSGRFAGTDAGLHHDADRAGGRLVRRHRLYDVLFGAGDEHDPGVTSSSTPTRTKR